jgi:uncharacterized glyoxalase superfamily protein PhnB
MTTGLVTYLSFDGQCEAAFKHYEKILGGQIVMMKRYADAEVRYHIGRHSSQPKLRERTCPSDARG